MPWLQEELVQRLVCVCEVRQPANNVGSRTVRDIAANRAQVVDSGNELSTDAWLSFRHGLSRIPVYLN